MDLLKGSRFGLYKDLLNSSSYFKLVCGAGNEDHNEVEYLTFVYTLAGCGGFDVSGPDTSSNPTGRSNRASQERGFSLHGADGGRVAYMMGGLADLVDIYD